LKNEGNFCGKLKLTVISFGGALALFVCWNLENLQELGTDYWLKV
jgi:hypothetical protein